MNAVVAAFTLAVAGGINFPEMPSSLNTIQQISGAVPGVGIALIWAGIQAMTKKQAECIPPFMLSTSR